MACTDVPALRAAMAELNAEHLAELTSALARCRNQFERDRCRLAYGVRFRMLEDHVAQSHGQQPTIAWRV